MESTKVVKNSIWLIGCRIVQAVLGFIVSMLTARYLGPSNYGLISYAASLVAFAAPIMKVGLDSIYVQELVNKPNEEGEILGTGLCMNIFSAVICMAGVVSFSLISDSGEIDTIIICALYSLTLLAQASEMIMYWFHAKLLSKYVSIVSMIAYLIVSAYKIVLLATESEVYWYAISYAIDYLLIGVILYVTYFKLTHQKLKVSFETLKRLFSKGKYYILSGLMVVIYGQTDRIMLKLFIDETAVGYYSAGVTCVSAASFVFSAIITSMQPIIYEGKKQSEEVFEKRVRQLYSIIVYMAVIESILLSILSEWIVRILYGSAYDPTIDVLRIIAWYTAFSYYGAAKDVWLLAENKQKYLVWINGTGAILNIILNCIFIPAWGINGAALASLLTQIFTNLVISFIIKDLRHNNLLLLQSLNPKYLVSSLKKLKKAIIKK